MLDAANALLADGISSKNVCGNVSAREEFVARMRASSLHSENGFSVCGTAWTWTQAEAEAQAEAAISA